MIRNRSAAHPLLAVLLALPMLAYLGVVLAWHRLGYYPITGDEPHYLLTADSLLRDGDLLVVDNHAIDTPVRRALPGGASLADTHSRNGYSIHGLALPLLVAPAYALGGVLGAQLLLAALAGLIAPLGYRAARAAGLGRGCSVALALGVGLGQPYVAGAGRVYPDLLAGLILLALLAQILSRRAPTPYSALLLALLPWLHLKLLLPAALICGAHLLAAWRAARRGARRPSPTPAHACGGRGGRSALRSYDAFVLLLFLFSLIALAAYNRAAFGSPLGPYIAGDVSTDPARVLLILAGLHLDRTQGLLMQAPLLWLALPGLAPMALARPRLALLWGVVYLSVALPQAAHTNWYGGVAPAGRFHWALAPLWCLPLAYGLRALTAPRGTAAGFQTTDGGRPATDAPSPAAVVRQPSAVAGPQLFAVLLMALLQAATLAKLLIPVDYAYTRPLIPAAAWLWGSPVGDWLDLGAVGRARWLPAFQDVAVALRSPVNWAAGGLALAAIWSGHRRLGPAAWAALLLGAALAVAALPPPIRPLDLSRPAPAASGGGGAGSITLADVALRPGRYAVELGYRCDGCRAARWACRLGGPAGQTAALDEGALAPGRRRLLLLCAIPPGAPATARLSLRLSDAAGAPIEAGRLRIWPLGDR